MHARKIALGFMLLWLAVLLAPSLLLAQPAPIRLADGYSVLRPMPESDIDRAAFLVSQYRDAAVDGIRQDGEIGFWTSKITHARRDGLVLGLYVNGGAIAGVVVVARDDMDRTRAVLWCVETMWDVLGTRKSMQDAALAWAKDNGLALGSFQRTWVPLQ